MANKGIELAFLLRHDKEYKFDEHGWRSVDDLINNHGYTQEMLDDIVATNNKKRFEYSEDKKYIRARQGHSVDVDVELKEVIPPNFLYHGTAVRFYDSILESGINSGTRLYVHLSDSQQLAEMVGKRHGEPVILTINAKRMHDDGIKFYLSNNGVWLTKFVDKKYII